MAMCEVPSNMQTGKSVYHNDFQRRISNGGSFSRPQNRLRKNRPHPPQDFLLPSRMNDGIELQKRVRRAVQEYMDQIYLRDDSRLSSRPPQFIPPYSDENLKPREILQPKTSDKVRSYPFYRESPPAKDFTIQGRQTPVRERPATSVSTEKTSPSHLQGESKRDRSVRIRQEIEKKNRVTTPAPQPKKWQRINSAVPTRQQKTIWANPDQVKRAVSAPPKQGYSYYKQSTKDNQPQAMYKPVQEKLSAWAENANDYEKQVIYSLLNKAAKPNDGTPSTPPSPQEAYHLLMQAKSGNMQHPPLQEDRNEKAAAWSPYFAGLRRQQAKHRHLHSAPVKPMLGLVPNMTQYPQSDQRIYRLKGQDSRVMGNPGEEKELREYMNKVARVTQKQWQQPEKKYLIAPMHTHPNAKDASAKDFQCDVSFFQSVRAPFKSHFTIHPQFTSENFIPRKRAPQMVSHLRY